MKKEIYALGIGAATVNFCDIAITAGYHIKGLYHYKEGKTGEIINGMPVLGTFDDLFTLDLSGKYFMLTMGDPTIRKELSEKIKTKGGILPSIIHPTAYIYPSAKISEDGVLIGPFVCIQGECKIKEGVVIRDMALIGHSSVVEPFSFVGPKSLIGSSIKIEERCFIGQGSILVTGKATPIGQLALVGAGAVVTKSVPPRVVMTGMPAKILKEL